MQAIKCLPWLGAGAMVVTLACSSPGTVATGEGELDRGTFAYECASFSDATCAFGSEPTGFPKAIALGGRFRLTYSPKKDNAPGTVRSAVASRVSRAGDEFTALAAGFSAMFARNTSGDVLDIKHIEARPVSDIRIRKLGDSLFVEEERVAVGQKLRVGAIPLDERETELAGGLPYVWSNTDESVVRIASSPNDDEVEIEALAPGMASVTVTHADITETLVITVEDAGTTTSSTGTGTTTGGSTSEGSGSTGGSSTGGSSTGGSTGGAT